MVLRHLRSDGYPQDAFAEMWVCGGRAESAEISAALALPYCFGQFLRPDLVPDVRDAYHKALPDDVEGVFALAVHVLCATSPSDVEAMTAMVASALPQLAEAPDVAPGLPFGYGVLVGTPETVHDHLLRLVEIYRPDELFTTTTCPDWDLRLASFQLTESIARTL